MSRPCVRFLTAADAGQAAALEAACFPTFWTEREFLEELGRDIFAGYGIFDATARPSGDADPAAGGLGRGSHAGGILLGYITMHAVAGELEVLNIAVSARRRGEGLAGMLMRAALSDVLAGGHLKCRNLPCGAGAGWETAFLEVRVSNAPAIALYQSLGFVDAGLRRGYCANGEDARIMTLGAARFRSGV